MKKLIALAVAIVMMAALAVPAFAAEVSTDGDTDVTVTYNPPASYTVTLPDSAAIGSTAVVSVDEAVLEDDTQIKITVKPKEGNAWVLTNSADETLNYTIKKGNDEIAVNGIVLTHAAGTEVPTEVTLSFALDLAEGQTAKAERYTQTITFKVEVEGPQA